MKTNWRSIDRGAFCRQCGYSLYGLPPAGDCPECGKRVAESLRSPPDLTQAPRPWLRRVRLGLWIVLASWLTLFMPLPLTYAAAVMGWFRGPFYFAIWPMMAGIFLLIVASVGLWVATPDAAWLPQPLRNVRILTRVAHAIFFVLLFIGICGASGLIILSVPFLAMFGWAGVNWARHLVGCHPIERALPGPIYPAASIAGVVILIFLSLAVDMSVTIILMIALLIAWALIATIVYRAIRAVGRAIELQRRLSDVDDPQETELVEPPHDP